MKTRARRRRFARQASCGRGLSVEEPSLSTGRLRPKDGWPKAFARGFSNPWRHWRPSALATLLFLPLLLAAPLRARAQVTYDGKRSLLVDDIFGTYRPLPAWGAIPYVTGWATPDPDTGDPRYLEFKDNGGGDVQLMRVDAKTGATSPLFDAPRMEAALAVLPGIDMTTAHRLAYREAYTLDTTQRRALIAEAGALYLYDDRAGRVTRLTAPGAKSGLAAGSESFSPDGKMAAFVRDGDLFVVDLAAPGKERRLTRGGGPRLLHGRLDWVYEEELYGRGRANGYAWSPDSNSLAFLQLDESAVSRFALVNSLGTQQGVEEQLYPHPGEPNPVAALGIVAADGRTPPLYADLTSYDQRDRLVVRFDWNRDGSRLACEVQDRAQTFLDLLVANPATGTTTRLFRDRTQGPWTDVLASPIFLKDGGFLWLSERTGRCHLYRYRRDGTLVGPVTAGDWDVRSVFGTDPAEKYVYFSATEHDPLASHLYRVALGGGGDASAAPPVAAAPEPLTPQEGTHKGPLDPIYRTNGLGGAYDASDGRLSGRFDPTFTYFLDQWSRLDQPPRLRVADAATGADVRLLGDSSDTVKQLSVYRFSRPELLHIPARDGAPLDAVLIRPPDFDPAKKYPVICPIYGGPGAQTVKDEWSGRDFLFWQLMAEKGYVVYLCDNRSASGKGAQSEWAIYRRLGATELDDIEDGLAYLKAQPGIDAGRIGIFGWSYGGFLAEYALTHSKTFKVGVAAAGVADWRLYDSIYTERYMDTPDRNPDGYKSTAPAGAASDCSGRLFLLHGQMDDNVHSQNTLQMAYGLEKANKRFDMMLYPGPEARHGFGDSDLDRHINTEIIDFLLRYL